MDGGEDLSGGASALPAGDLRLVQTLLWTIVSEALRPAEIDEVKRAIGFTLIEENESLYEEASALAEILGDVQVSTAAQMERHNLCANPQRRLIESEIMMLMDRLRDAASTTPFSGSAVRDRDPESVVPKANPTEKNVYNYITTVPLAEHRPRTASSRPGSASASGRPGSACGSLRPGSGGRPGSALMRPNTASTRCSRPSTASSAGSGGSFDPGSIVQQVQDKLNVRDIDLVRDRIREALSEEKTSLHEDIEFLQAMLEDEADFQMKASAPPPSVQELKEYSSTLQSHVNQEESRAQHEARVCQMFSAAEVEHSKAGRLRGLVGASRAGPEGHQLGSVLSDQDTGIRLTRISESPAEVLSLQNDDTGQTAPTALRTRPSSSSRPSSDPSPSSSRPNSKGADSSRPTPKGADGVASSSEHHDPGHLPSTSTEAKPQLGTPTRQGSSRGAALPSHNHTSSSPVASRSSSLTAGVRLSPISVAPKPPRALAPLKPDNGVPHSPPMRSAAPGPTTSKPSTSGSKSSTSGSTHLAASTTAPPRAGQPPTRAKTSPPAAVGLQPGNGGLGGGANGALAGKKPARSVADMLEAEIDTALSGGVAAILAKHGIRNPSRGGEGS